MNVVKRCPEGVCRIDRCSVYVSESGFGVVLARTKENVSTSKVVDWRRRMSRLSRRRSAEEFGEFLESFGFDAIWIQ